MRNIKFAGLLFLISFTAPPEKKITVWLIGDSTMSAKEVRAYPETGWGMPFVHYFDTAVTVDNRAKNGRSTRTFREEGLWQPVLQHMQPGDYVFIQFGHNDEVPTKKSATLPEVFKSNLEKYISETRSKKAYPVLLTPVARRLFDEKGKIVGTHDEYAGIVRTVALQQKVPLIDLDKKGQVLYQQMGVESSKLLFNWLQPGEHPNYPDGKQDNTHFNELGARKIAAIVLADIRALKLPLAERIVQPKQKK